VIYRIKKNLLWSFKKNKTTLNVGGASTEKNLSTSLKHDQYEHNDKHKNLI